MGFATSASRPQDSSRVHLDARDEADHIMRSYMAGESVVLDARLTAPAREQVRALVSQLLPPLDKVVRRGSLLQAHRNAQARVELAEEFGLMTAVELARHVSSTAKNVSETARRWRAARKTFAVSWDGALVYPGFQFDEGGRPLPVVAEVIAAVGDRLQGWDLALWFTADSSWLDGDRPVDLLRRSPGDVVDAARSAVADPVE